MEKGTPDPVVITAYQDRLLHPSSMKQPPVSYWLKEASGCGQRRDHPRQGGSGREVTPSWEIREIAREEDGSISTVIRSEGGRRMNKKKAKGSAVRWGLESWAEEDDMAQG